MRTKFNIGKHCVGPDQPTYFIADIAANHDGDLERAKDLIHMGAEVGVNAAKFQNFTADTLVSDIGFKSLDSNNTHQANWKKSVFEMYDEASIPIKWCKELKQTCDDVGIDYFTSLYDLGGLPHISPYVSAWKIGSGDITWHDLIEKFSSDGKPILLATGASEMREVSAAMNVILRNTSEVVLMQCNTNYTGSSDNFRHIELNVLKTFAEQFPQSVLGLSDHTPGHATVLGAVALGARVIEKHFTDDPLREGSDHSFSMSPKTWRDMVERTRELEFALGQTEKKIMSNEVETRIVQRRCARATVDMEVGVVITKEHLCFLRPSPNDSISPCDSDFLIGKKLKRSMKKGQHFDRSFIKSENA